MTAESKTLLPKSNGSPTVFGDVLWAPKLMYTVANMGISAYINYLTIFYENTAHYSKFQIGILQALPCICTLLAPPLWCAVADKYQSHRPIHILITIVGTLFVYAISLSRSFVVTVSLVLLANCIISPFSSLLDHSVLDMIAQYGGEYGKQRLFGAVGAGAGAFVAGLVVSVGGIAWAFNTSLFFLLSSLLVLHQIPVPRHHDEDHESSAIQGGHKPSFSHALGQLAHKTDVLVLLVVVFLMALMYGVLSSFLTLNLYNLSGQDANIVGIAILCETTSELPAFFFAQRLIDRLGTPTVLLLSIVGYILRITYYAFMTNAWSAIPFEWLHGLTFGIAWAATTQYLYNAAPRGAESTMMGLLNAVQNGAGRGVGTLIGGYFYEHYGARTMWLVTDLGVPLALSGLAVFVYTKDQAKTTIELMEIDPHS